MNPYIHFPVVLGKMSCLLDLFKNRFGERSKSKQKKKP